MVIQTAAERLPVIQRLAVTPRKKQRTRCVLPAASRGMGIFFCATRGSGKSRALGRCLAWSDLTAGVPLVIIDPVGGSIDNLIDKIRRQPLEEQEELWPRIRYVNMAGQAGRVVPWPIYYEVQEGERFSDRSKRFVATVRRMDPALQNASVMGMNSLARIAEAGGIVLSALGLGITELWDLVTNPRAWRERLEEVERRYPETAAAVDELRRLEPLSDRDRAFRLDSLGAKLSMFRFNPNFKAIFGATTPGINWQEVVEKRQAVLLDFRDIQDSEIKKFCLLWVYNSFLTFIKQRGHGHMDEPISFIIDELSYLVSSAAVNGDLLTADLDELINRIARSHGIWLTLAIQELFQLPEKLRSTVQAMGTVIFGQTSDPQAAEELARRYYPYDPYKVKKSRTIYAPASRSMRGYRESVPVPVGDQTTEFTRNEQNYINSRPFLQLAPLHFLIGQSRREGELPRELREIDLEELDPGQFPERSVTDPLREALMCRDGVQESQALREIAARLAPPGTTPAAQEEETAPAVVGDPVLKEPAAEVLKEPAMPGCINPIRSARARQPRPRSGRPKQS